MIPTEVESSSLKNSVSAIKILIADDHEVMRLGMRNLLESRKEWTVCAEASNGKEAVERASECRPDVAILDIAMPTMNGIEAANLIAGLSPKIPVILFSLHLSDELMNQFQIGAVRGAVSKSEAGRDLVEAVDTVLQGGTFFRGRKTFPAAHGA